MLMIARREGETIELYLSPDIDPATPIGDILGTHPITIKVDKMRASQVALAIDAPQAILVMRDELVDVSELRTD